MPLPDALRGLIGRQLDAASQRGDRDVGRLVGALERRFGEHLVAVLLYGSYLRGRRDTLLDFYVLLDGYDALPRWQAWANRALPPNVYYLALPESAEGGALRAKYATVTLDRFERAMGDYHGYFWSRFTQPCGLVQVRGEAERTRVTDALAGAVHTFVATVAPILPDAFGSERLWSVGLGLTYASELRAEDPAGAAALYRHDTRHFDDVLEAYAANPTAAVVRSDGHYLQRAADQPRAARGSGRFGWLLRRLQGKVLSVLRLVKAAGTFDDPLDYVLWKIQRHSGIYIAPSERQRRHPLIFAWPLLWRLYRRGAFR